MVPSPLTQLTSLLQTHTMAGVNKIVEEAIKVEETPIIQATSIRLAEDATEAITTNNVLSVGDNTTL